MWQNVTRGFTREKKDILLLQLCSNMPWIRYPVEVNTHVEINKQNKTIVSTTSEICFSRSANPTNYLSLTYDTIIIAYWHVGVWLHNVLLPRLRLFLGLRVSRNTHNNPVVVVCLSQTCRMVLLRVNDFKSPSAFSCMLLGLSIGRGRQKGEFVKGH